MRYVNDLLGLIAPPVNFKQPPHYSIAVCKSQYTLSLSISPPFNFPKERSVSSTKINPITWSVVLDIIVANWTPNPFFLCASTIRALVKV